MIKTDNLIDNLRTFYFNSRIENIEFKNLYTKDKEFEYQINKNRKEVIVTYKDTIHYSFILPIIPITLRPPISYLFFFSKRYTYNVIDSFKLQYLLSLHYIICLHTHIKNVEFPNKKKIGV